MKKLLTLKELNEMKVAGAERDGHLIRAVASGGSIAFEIWKIERETPCGFWLVDEYGIFRTWRKAGTRFASRTREGALEMFYHRCRARLRHARRGLELAEQALKSACEATGRDFEVARLPTHFMPTHYMGRGW